MEAKFNVYKRTSAATNRKLEANFLPTRSYDLVAIGITQDMKADWTERRYIVLPVGVHPETCVLKTAHAGNHLFCKTTLSVETEQAIGYCGARA